MHSNPADRTSPLSPGGDTQGEGHGTHTAGSIAGEVIINDSDQQRLLSQYNGMAYKAKLAVWDFDNPRNLPFLHACMQRTITC
jgi:hypothetical protein